MNLIYKFFIFIIILTLLYFLYRYQNAKTVNIKSVKLDNSQSDNSYDIESDEEGYIGLDNVSKISFDSFDFTENSKYRYKPDSVVSSDNYSDLNF